MTIAKTIQFVDSKKSSVIEDIVQFYQQHPVAVLLFLFAIISLAMVVVWNSPHLCQAIRKVHETRLPQKIQPKIGKKALKYETRCRETLESMFWPHKFPNVRPTWLRNPKTNRCLEIDCFNAELGLGLEMDGAFHKEFSSFYHKNQQGFEYQKWKDAFKRQRCREHGIVLFTVPHTIEYKDLDRYIYKMIMKSRFGKSLK